MSGFAKLRKVILTGGITAVVATGAIFGAQLKGTQEIVQQQQEIKQTSPDELIETLQGRINGLQKARAGLQQKISNLENKMNSTT